MSQRYCPFLTGIVKREIFAKNIYTFFTVENSLLLKNEDRRGHSILSYHFQPWYADGADR